MYLSLILLTYVFSACYVGLFGRRLKVRNLKILANIVLVLVILFSMLFCCHVKHLLVVVEVLGDANMTRAIYELEFKYLGFLCLNAVVISNTCTLYQIYLKKNYSLTKNWKKLIIFFYLLFVLCTLYSFIIISSLWQYSYIVFIVELP